MQKLIYTQFEGAGTAHLAPLPSMALCQGNSLNQSSINLEAILIERPHSC